MLGLAEAQPLSGLQQPAFQQARERNARRSWLVAWLVGCVAGRRRFDSVEALLRDGDVTRVSLDANPVAAQLFGDRAGRAGAEERVEDNIARTGTRRDDAPQQRFGLLRGVNLVAVDRQPFRAGTDRQPPDAAHLLVLVAGFQRMVVEGIARAPAFLRPQQRF